MSRIERLDNATRCRSELHCKPRIHAVLHGAFTYRVRTGLSFGPHRGDPSTTPTRNLGCDHRTLRLYAYPDFRNHFYALPQQMKRPTAAGVKSPLNTVFLIRFRIWLAGLKIV